MTETMPRPVSIRNYSPKEFSQALERFGIYRTARWVSDHCPKHIHTLPAFRPRHVIPETELKRIVSITRKEEKK